MGPEEIKSAKWRPGYLAAMLCLVIALGVAFASCGSSDDDSTSSGGSETSSEEGGATSSEVEAAEAVVEEAKAEPTEIGVTEPLKSKPPAGKTVVWLNCDFSQCQLTQESMEDAAKAIGWNFKSVAYKSADPATLVAAFKQALQYDPSGVALSGVNSAAWPSVIPEYEKAGVPIVEGLAGPQELNNALVANLWNEEDLAEDARIIANWVTADSGGEASSVVMGVPDFPILGGFASAFGEALKEACKACESETVDATIEQIGSPTEANGLLVSAVQKNPDIEYVITSDGALNPGLGAALSGAGIEGKPIAGALGTEINQTEIQAGEANAFTGQNFDYYGWLLLDAILRHEQGIEIAPGNGGMPHQLFTEDNIEAPSENMAAPVNFEEEFETLWQVK